MKKLLYAIMLFSLCLACTDRQTARRLDRAQSLADSQPAEARGILDSLRPQLSGLSRSQLMRYHLTRIQTDNLLDSTLHEDSLMRQVAEYYDDHGTANERMLAYYLLGRTYSDMGEAPQALQAFHDAIDRADTTSSDCDYRRLSRIYGQMAGLFYYNFMPRHQLSVLRLAERYALKDRDTLSFLIYKDKAADAYSMLGIQDSVIAISKKSYFEFRKRLHTDFAAQALGILIYAEIEKGNYSQAWKYLNNYERESGFIKKNGTVIKGKEYYYHAKGLCYVGLEKYDSALFFIQKFFGSKNDLDTRHSTCKALIALYQGIGNKDSVIKYSILSEKLNDSLYLKSYSSLLNRMQSNYDYNKHLKRLEEMRTEKERTKRISLTISSLMFIFLLLSYIMFLLYKKKKERHLAKIESEYAATKIILSAAQNDLISFREIKSQNGNLAEKIKEKENLIEHLRKKIYLYERIKKTSKGIKDSEELLKESNIYKSFSKYGRLGLFKVRQKDWDELFLIIDQHVPHFKTELLSNGRITDKDYKECVLLALGFKTGEIANILQLKSSTISTDKVRLAQKLLKKHDSFSNVVDYLKKMAFHNLLDTK